MPSGKWALGKSRRPELATTRWRNLSEQIRREEPLCRPCWKKGRTTRAEQVDHMDEDEPDFFLRSNLQPICARCNIEKEMKRKGYTPKKRIGLDGFPIDE